MMLGDPLNLVIAILAIGFVYMAGFVAGRMNRDPQPKVYAIRPYSEMWRS